MTHFINVVAANFWPLLKAGLIYTIPLSIVCFGLGFVLAIVVALLEVARVKVLRQICAIYVWIFRGTPMLVQLFIIYFGLPSLGVNIGALPAGIIGLTLNMGAYMSETIRGAIVAIDQGQVEAGYACGFTYNQTMFHIILPQAIKNAVPVLFNHFITLVKDTSLVSTITIPEMFMKAQIIAAANYEVFTLYVEVAFIYLMFCTVLNLIQNFVEKKLNLSGAQS